MERTFSIIGKDLEHGLTIGPGGFKLPSEIIRYASHPALALIVLGSITPERRDTYPDAWRVMPHSSGNSLSMPNPGAREIFRNLPEMLDACHSNGKLLCISIAAFNPQQYGNIAYMLADADILEINAGCPNTRGEGGKLDPIVSLVPELLAEVIERVEEAVGQDGPALSVKLSPLYPQLLEEVAEVIAHTSVGIVATSNTWPNGLLLNEDGSRVFQHYNSYVGISGPGMFEATLGQLDQMKTLLPDREFIFTNGIRTGRQAVLAHLVGASVVECVSAWYNNTYERVFEEYVGEMAKVEE